MNNYTIQPEYESRHLFEYQAIPNEPDYVVFEENKFMTYQPFYDFAASLTEGNDVYTYDIPQDDLDAYLLLPQWEVIQLIYTDLRWNGGEILNSMFTALGDCINQQYEVNRCLYQQSVIQQVYGDYPAMDMGNAPYGTDSDNNAPYDYDPSNQSGEFNYGNRPLDFTN